MHPWGSSACSDGKGTNNTYFLGQSDCEHHTRKWVLTCRHQRNSINTVSRGMESKSLGLS